MNKRVGLLGGTFDPVHFGHLMLAENAFDALKLDEILFIVSGKSYLKDNVSPAKDRLEMTSLAISDNPHYALSTIETDRGENVDSYSYETILELKRANPDTEYHFLVGADSFLYMENWMKAIGVAMNLKELGVNSEMIDSIEKATILLEGGYKKLTREEVAWILKQSL